MENLASSWNTQTGTISERPMNYGDISRRRNSILGLLNSGCQFTHVSTTSLPLGEDNKTAIAATDFHRDIDQSGCHGETNNSCFFFLPWFYSGGRNGDDAPCVCVCVWELNDFQIQDFPSPLDCHFFPHSRQGVSWPCGSPT